MHCDSSVPYHLQEFLSLLCWKRDIKPSKCFGKIFRSRGCCQSFYDPNSKDSAVDLKCNVWQ